MNAPVKLTISQKHEPDIVRTEDLFDGTNMLTILHDGMSYTLRITRQGKLLLTK